MALSVNIFECLIKDYARLRKKNELHSNKMEKISPPQRKTLDDIFLNVQNYVKGKYTNYRTKTPVTMKKIKLIFITNNTWRILKKNEMRWWSFRAQESLPLSLQK